MNSQSHMIQQLQQSTHTQVKPARLSPLSHSTLPYVVSFFESFIYVSLTDSLTRPRITSHKKIHNIHIFRFACQVGVHANLNPIRRHQYVNKDLSSSSRRTKTAPRIRSPLTTSADKVRDLLIATDKSWNPSSTSKKAVRESYIFYSYKTHTHNNRSRQSNQFRQLCLCDLMIMSKEQSRMRRRSE